MFAIEYMVGSTYGGWITGNDRFSTREAATREIEAQSQQERAQEITPFPRRIVPA